MIRFLTVLVALWGAAASAVEVPIGPSPTTRSGEKKLVHLIPVQGPIAQPTLYIVRRALKEAIEQKADAVVLDMDTPGGEAGTMLEIMAALDKFSGQTITYVNAEAGSAGAIIAAVTDEIYFAPTGVMGAAEVIMGTGQDLSDGLKRKMTSFINAKIRAFSDNNPRRAEVLKAMTTADFELKVGDEVIKTKGELLTVTAKEAVAMYGEPPTPLLARGIAENIESLLTDRFGAEAYTLTRHEITWSERAAQYLNLINPILMGLGMLALFIEFKTPGFGWIGASGLALMAVVFFGQYVSGLSGHEPAIAFAVGLLLLAVELFVFPGTVLPALLGLALILGSLLWAMADIWPNEPVKLDGDLLLRPALNLALGLAIAVGGAVMLLRYLPRSWFWDKLVLASVVSAKASHGQEVSVGVTDPLLGALGVAVTGMYPSGEVEIAGRRYQARVELGMLEAGAPVVVKGRADFVLLVERSSG